MENMKARMANKLKRAANSRWGNLMKKSAKKPDASLDEWASENPVSLVFHNSQHSLADLLVNCDTLPEVEVNDILQITPVGFDYPPIILQVTEASLDAAKTKAITLSINNLAAAAFGLGFMRQVEVNVKKVKKEAFSLDWIQLSLKDQNVSRCDQWLFSKKAIGLAVFKTQRLQVGGIKTQVSRMNAKGNAVTCGVITAKTKVVFSSKSCTMAWIIEASKEMWEVAEDGLLYFERALEFIKTYFERCLLNATSHHITVAWYARILYPSISPEEALELGLQKLNTGMWYQDVYKPILEVTDLRLWRQAMLVIKREFSFIPAILNWQEDCPNAALKYFERFPMSRYAEEIRFTQSPALKFVFSPEMTSLSKVPTKLSHSHRSNSLETFNLCLDNFSSLVAKGSFTGQRIVALTAGPGVYFTDDRLPKVTKERIMTSGCCVDLISLRRRPLHATPLLVYNWENPLEASQEDELYLAMDRSEKDGGKNYCFPYWLNVHYFYYFTQLEGTVNMQGALHNVYCDRSKLSITYSINTSLKSAPTKSLDSLVDKQFIIADELMQTPSVRSAVRNFCKAYDSRVASFENDRPAHFSGYTTPKLGTITRFGSRMTLFKEGKNLISNDESPDPFSDLISDYGSQHSGRGNSDWHPSSSAASNEQFNPFGLSITRPKVPNLKRRWEHTFPQNREDKQSNDFMYVGSMFYSEGFLKDAEQQWLSFIEPTLLPMTTDAWPRSDQLGESQPYQLFIHAGQEREIFIDQLISARMNRDFQLVTSESEKHGNSRYLSHGLFFHIIIPSETDDYNIEFRTYVRKQPHDPVSALCLVFDANRGGFVLRKSTYKLGVFNDWAAEDSRILGH